MQMENWNTSLKSLFLLSIWNAYNFSIALRQGSLICDQELRGQWLARPVGAEVIFQFEWNSSEVWNASGKGRMGIDREDFLGNTVDFGGSTVDPWMEWTD